MLRFRASLPESGEPFESRREYIDDRTGESFTGLCHVMEWANEPITPKGTRGGPETPDMKLTPGFPWLTLVLGSGCLESLDSADGQELSHVPHNISACLMDRPELPDGTHPSELATEFAETLISSRLGAPPSTSAPHEPPPPSPDLELTAEALLLCALLTRFFYRTRAASLGALSRWGDDTAVAYGDDWDDVRAQVTDLAPALPLLDALLSRLKQADDQDARALHAVLSAIQATLKPASGLPGLRAPDLQVLTELAWYRITKRALVYPGWSDLLLDLSMRGGLPPLRHGQARPAFTRDDLGPKYVVERYQDVTRASWEARAAGTTERHQFYDSIATVLRLQAARFSEAEEADLPPIASAFVTSFDLELEMALLSQPELEAFVIALPFYLFRNRVDADLRMASLCWLGCVVTPDQEADSSAKLEGLLSPKEWFVLSGTQDGHYRSEEYASFPIVVRLAGCPLIGRPHVASGAAPGAVDFEALKKVFPEEPVPQSSIDDGPQRGLPGAGLPADPNLDASVIEASLGHAVLLDEYVALQQTAMESYLYMPKGQRLKDVRRYGLPSEISGPAPAFARFWAIMGVQIRDSAIRYRLASQIPTPPPSGGPRRSGMVVSRHLDAADQDLLFWFGFDIVRGACRDFHEDFTHYAKHLARPSIRIASNQLCPIQ
jgi:hypothetical protein